MTIDRRTALSLAAGGLVCLSGEAWGRPAAEILRPGREVLAFYYGWYGTPAMSGGWRHWPGATGREAPSQGTILDHPLAGLYDSHDPAIVGRHADMLKRAGMTGIISSWWGQRGEDGRRKFEDVSLGIQIDIMHERGLKVCAYIEQQSGHMAGAISDLSYLLRTYGQHPAWLKVSGRPVFFIYLEAIRRAPNVDWRAAAKAAAAATGLPEPVLIGDVSAREGAYAAKAAPFDGTHTYVMAPYIGATQDKPGMTPGQIADYVARTYPQWKATVRGAGKIYVATVGPGFDDHLARPGVRPVFDRSGTGSLDALWKGAIDTGADWVVVTTFNEWHEGSEIEPSIEYGDRFITDNARWARIFLDRG